MDKAMSNKRKAVVSSAIDLMEINNGDYSFRDIAKKVNCSTTLIVNYYGDKNKLNDVCFDEICRRMSVVLSDVKMKENADNEDMKDYLLDVWDAFIDYITEHPGQTKFYLSRYIDGHTLPVRSLDTDAIVMKLLRNKMNDIQQILPNLSFVTTLMRDVAHGVVIGIARGDFANIDGYRKKIRAIIKNGL